MKQCWRMSVLLPVPQLALCHGTLHNLQCIQGVINKPAQLSCRHSQEQVEAMQLGIINAKLGHLMGKGQLQDTFLLRSGVARAAVCALDRLEREEVAPSIDRPPHSCENCTEGWQFVLCKAALITDLPLYARPSFTCPCVSSVMLPTDQHRKEGCILGVHISSRVTLRCASYQ